MATETDNATTEIDRLARMTTCDFCGMGNGRQCVTKSGYFTRLHQCRVEGACNLYHLGHRHGVEYARRKASLRDAEDECATIAPLTGRHGEPQCRHPPEPSDSARQRVRGLPRVSLPRLQGHWRGGG